MKAIFVKLLLSPCVLFLCSLVTTPPVLADDNVVLQWDQAALQAVRNTRMGPPMTARALAIVHTGMYDAWVAYDPVAAGTRLGGALRRPPEEHTLANKQKAVSYAAYRALIDLFPVSQHEMFARLMTSLGYDPNDNSTDTATPAGIGNVTAIRYLFKGQRVTAWAGPFRGRQLILGEDWQPYQQASFLTPPFGEYVSGHSAFSTASAEILKSFTGSDDFGASVTLPAGSSRIEPGMTPAADLILHWETFSAAAEEASLSRLYGGIHFTDGNVQGRVMGRKIGAEVWKKAQAYFQGVAPGN